MASLANTRPDTRSGLLTLHSLVPERFFKVQKAFHLTAETAGKYVLKQSAVLTFQAFELLQKSQAIRSL